MGITRLPYLPPEKSICRSRSNSYNWTWSNRLVPNRKTVSQGYILSPCLFNLYTEYIMRNAGLDEAQAGIKIAGRNINNLRHADDTTLMEESEEELKKLFLGPGPWCLRIKTILHFHSNLCVSSFSLSFFLCFSSFVTLSHRLVRNFNTMLNRSGENSYPCFVPDVTEKHPAFYY